MNAITLKYVHIVAVAVSFALFFVRGLWVMRSYPSPQETWVRYLPHVIDGVLVASAIGLLLMSKAPWPGAWMTAKLVMVLVYAILALVVLRLARTLALRVLAWLAALLLFLFVTTVAILRDPMGILSLM